MRMVDLSALFPAPAGMNRPAASSWPLMPAVPRASGDEPEQVGVPSEKLSCSPRQRG